MGKKIVSLFYIVFLFLFGFNCLTTYALEVKTHEAINEYIAKNTLNGFSLSDYLDENLGFRGGEEEEIKGQKVYKWLCDGGKYEDKPLWTLPYLRSVNHFHDPLTDAGFTGIWGSVMLWGDSSLYWAQDPIGTQDPGGHYSWHDVRDYFYKALTSDDNTIRQKNFSDTFRGLGQLMHLVEDLSVPEHTRDDGHYVFYNYEDWVTEMDANGLSNVSIQPQTGLISVRGVPVSPVFFDPSVLGNINLLAAVPVANLFDTDQYNGTNPNITMQNNIGLSEYTNANFLSPDSIFTDAFPHPAWSNVTENDQELDPITGKLRTYIKKTGYGETINHLATAGWFYKYLPSDSKPLGLKLDNTVYSDYAALLIPRAVGYSAGLLNYFFRGNIEITLPVSGVYATTDDPNLGFTTITLLAMNTTPNDEEMPDGSIELVVKYRLALEDPFQSKAVLTTEDFYYIVVQESDGIRSIPRNTPQELNFDLNPAIPLYATDVYLQIVYNGKLGNEDGAVAVGFKDISEPTPVDLFNNMDKICLNGTWYDAGSAEAIAQIDTNQNGIADEWDVYAHDLSDAYLKVSPTGSPMPASPQNYTFDPYTVPAGTLYRAYVLGDIQFGCGDYAKAAILDANDFWIHDNAVFQWLMTGSTIKNQVDYNVESQEECAKVGADAPCDIRSYPVFYTFRNRNIWGRAGFILDSPKYPPNADCPWELLQEAE